jgi:site-specific DNA-methyltransferase (cytosine-N4-specific)
MIVAKAEDFLASPLSTEYRGKVRLILTSPPFPLNRKKKYGNKQGEEYIRWLSSFGRALRDLLLPDGSVVIEMGNAWEPGHPVMSTLALRALIAFLDDGDYFLCQQFVCHNPARLPTPAQWVNVERIRVKDSFTHIWWLSPTDRPKANNRRVPKEYSKSMLKLLESQRYNSGLRPSGHHIGESSFLRDNAGAIPSNVLTFANTAATDGYQRYCRTQGLRPHPARMPKGVADFFIRFLSDPGEIVLDPFAGSNTTGATAEGLERSWLSVEPIDEYVKGSMGRFPGLISGE